ncbi:MAG: PEGA domain-containing protein [Myxococcaceae bacterium]
MLAPLLLLLVMAGPAKGTRLDQAQKAFVSGDYDGALKLLDPMQDATDSQTLERVQLLRAQCFAAQQNFSKAEDAFTLALEANPEASLDPARVDPSVVKVLDSLRARLTGELVVTSNPKAEIYVDGKALGATPVSGPAPIGRHKVEAKIGDQTSGAEAVVYVHRPTQVVFAQSPGGLGPPVTTPEAPSKIRPFGDFRGVYEAGGDEGGLELGGGVEFPYTRVGVSARLWPQFGFTIRAGLVVPIIERLNAYLELEVPFLFRSSAAVGLGGVVGGEFLFSKWAGVFVQIGGRHYFVNPDSNADNRFIFAGGVRLRLP